MSWLGQLIRSADRAQMFIGNGAFGAIFERDLRSFWTRFEDPAVSVKISDVGNEHAHVIWDLRLRRRNFR